jgi:hypothetical protein
VKNTRKKRAKARPRRHSSEPESHKVLSCISTVLRKRRTDSPKVRDAKQFLSDLWAEVGIDEMQKWGVPKRTPGRPKGVLQDETRKLINAIAENDAKPRSEKIPDRRLYESYGLPSYLAGRIFRTKHRREIAAAHARFEGIKINI